MPIRDYDMYADSKGKAIPIASNRGASGIDGSVASFYGFSEGHNKSGTSLIGDIALLHDLNSLALLKESSNPLTIVVINNNGGGIFSFLPVSQCDEIFEPYFGTPHNLTFEKAASMFSINYHNPKTVEQFIDIYQIAQTDNKPTLIEITTDRNDNYREHQKIQSQLKQKLDNI